MSRNVERLLKRLDQLLPEQVKPWRPQAGAQALAYHSAADELGFGGQPGGGKTNLLLGLALTAHHRSLILRREATQLRELLSQLESLYPNYQGTRHIDLPDGRSLELGGVKQERDKQKWKGRPHDLKAFDELTEFTKSQYEFINIWNRSPHHRCRIVSTLNPPTSIEGRWVIDYFAPWLDPKHPQPAQSGELRYYHQGEAVEATHKDARSRTFIFSSLADNPILAATGYGSLLASLPPELQSIANLNFAAGIEDNPYQVIPLAWVEAAMSRPPDLTCPQDAIAIDPARGGSDRTAIAARHGSSIALWDYAGKSTPDGQAVILKAMLHRRTDAHILVDIIGIGAAVYDLLKLQGHSPTAVNNSARSLMRDRSGQFGFANVRAEQYWKLRELLDPNYGSTLSLPDNPKLKAELTAPRYSLTLHGIAIESKQQIKARLGRSPDLADAVVMVCALPLLYTSAF